MMKPRYILPVLCLAATLSACQKDIDFEYHRLEPITVIEGNLTTSYTTVQITETTAVDDPMNRTLYTDATVMLSDLTAGTERQLFANDEGIFTAMGGGIPSHEYKLTVQRGGKTFAAVSQMLMPAVIVDLNMYWIKMAMGKMVTIQVVFLDPPTTQGDCFIIRFYRNGIMTSYGTISDIQAADGVLVASTMGISADDVPGGHPANENDKFLHEGDIITASVTPVPRSFYDYIVALNQGSNGARMFDGTGDFCLGYFLAAPESLISKPFHGADMPTLEY